MAVGHENPARDLVTNHEYPIPPLIIWLLVHSVPQNVPLPLALDEV